MHHRKTTRAHKKRKKHQGSKPTETGVGGKKVGHVKTKGGRRKTRITQAEVAHVEVGGKYVKQKINSVEENPANKDYTRRNIITKGAVLLVEDDKQKQSRAKVTSRPGQD
ncbi:MAG: 30S ribosomal protein S8e, partial [Candidatus Altiarchaeales archaeon]|nr:30S ribosomal protein S8e [Candidatus Altiarchaeales archaeon]